MIRDSLPKLSESSRSDLESELSVEDLLKAIHAFPSGKAAGPDGFGCKVFKTFSRRLDPYMLRMLQDSIQRKKLPDSLYEANICVVLKKGKPETDPANYRPIALLNFDQKVLLKYWLPD